MECNKIYVFKAFIRCYGNEQELLLLQGLYGNQKGPYHAMCEWNGKFQNEIKQFVSKFQYAH